jgi:hypothetical protein
MVVDGIRKLLMIRSSIISLDAAFFLGIKVLKAKLNTSIYLLSH